jgi:hypothetical protein
MSDADTLLARLAELTRLLEEHRAAEFLLENERMALQLRLRGTGWKPPSTEAGA